MFSRIKFALSTKRIFKSWGGNSWKPTINELIVATPFVVLRKLQKDSFLFTNKYVCADAVIIACAHAIKILEEIGAPVSVISDIRTKAVSAIECEYSIPSLELLDMQRNRFSHFRNFLNKHEDTPERVVGEASLLFLHDLQHNSYVPYSENSPVVIIGFDKQMEIEMETISFFKIALKSVTDCVRLYLE